MNTDICALKIEYMPFLKLIRFPNLLIVALTQYILYYAIVKPFLGNPIDPVHFFLIVLYSILIAAAGYIINDIEDMEIDAFNKPIEKRIVGRIYSINRAWRMYGLLNFLSLIIALYSAYYEESYILLMSLPFVIISLHVYSTKWKCQPLIGNIVVALLCAFTPYIIFLISLEHEKDIDIIYMTKNGLTLNLIFNSYVSFAFISTLYREIIKDIEDMEGDRKQGCKTLPIVLGIKKSKNIALLVSLIFLLSSFYFAWTLRGEASAYILILTISLPIIYTIFLLLKAVEKKHFTYLSSIIKWIMLSGLLFVLVIYYFCFQLL